MKISIQISFCKCTLTTIQDIQTQIGGSAFQCFRFLMKTVFEFIHHTPPQVLPNTNNFFLCFYVTCNSQIFSAKSKPINLNLYISSLTIMIYPIKNFIFIAKSQILDKIIIFLCSQLRDFLKRIVKDWSNLTISKLNKGH